MGSKGRTTFFVIVLVALALAGAPHIGRADVAASSVANPTLSDPPAGIRGYPLWDSWFELHEYGYEEQEFFVSGTARQASGATAPYTTRIIVTRPTAASGKFSGNVLLDWVNVTAQFENAVDTVEAHEFLLREGWAFVHVSAQSAGICCTPLTPKVWDPVRYAALSHPGDAYANDMFSQVAQALKSPQDTDPLAGLPGDRLVIAAGQSQSASRLSSYVREAQPGAGVIDGFLIHGGGSKTFDAPPSAPVLHLLSDAEASPAEPNQSGNNYRLWEIAGSAHSDFWIGYHQEFGQGPRFAGGPKRPASAEDEMHQTAGNYGEMPHPMHATCIFAGAAFPTRYSVSAALHHLDIWIRTGTPPPEGPRYQFNGNMLARDEHRNALGGIRLPPVDVPVASYESAACVLGGLTRPFTELELLQLYPEGHAQYYGLTKEKTVDAVAAGFLLPEDAHDLLTRACAARIRWQDLSGAPCDTDITIEVDGLVHIHGAIKRKGSGTAPVTLCSTSPVRPLDVVPSSLRFEGSSTGGETHDEVHPTDPADACGDSAPDGVAHIRYQGPTVNDGRACVTGRTTTGLQFRGCDTV